MPKATGDSLRPGHARYGALSSGREEDAAAARDLARRVRIATLDALHRAGGGHYGGSLSVVDVLVALQSAREAASAKAGGDRLVLSKGHAAMALYALQAELGVLGRGLERFGKYGGGLEGHPDMLETPGIHFSTGSLGQGLAVGVGMAMALEDGGAHVWVVLGDGECQEGQVWESAMIAWRHSLSRLHVVVDLNGAQECGWPAASGLDGTPLPDAEAKWRAFGWTASTLDGHDPAELRRWIDSVTESGRGPTVAIARTRKGCGVAAFESAPEKYHCAELSDEEYRAARRELTG